MQVITLTREEYLKSVKKLEDFESLKFAKNSLDWWDTYYSWEKFPPLCLIDNFNEHRCYLFYNISKDKEYLSIHNILTPKKYRKMGYAYTLLAHMFSELSNEEIQRFKLWCVSSSVSFYSKLGLHYWGVNELGQYYCDFAMPKLSIKEIPSIIKDTKLKEFSTIKLNQIYEKIQQNGSEFSDKERRIYDNCVQKMKYRYRFESFVQEVRDRKLVKR